jgi:hypothetical protein
MGGDLAFKASSFLFRRLANQHPLAWLPHAIELRVLVEAHRGLQMLKVGCVRIGPWLTSTHPAELVR